MSLRRLTLLLCCIVLEACGDSPAEPGSDATVAIRVELPAGALRGAPLLLLLLPSLLLP